jgi:hypothetical protein
MSMGHQPRVRPPASKAAERSVRPQALEVQAHFIQPPTGAPVILRNTVVALAGTLALLTAGCTVGGADPLTTSAAVTSTAISVYSDALAAGWADWSWASHNLANTTPVALGARSIAVTYGPWQGLYFHSAGVSTAGLANLEFQVNGGATGGAALTACVTVGGVQQTKVAIGPYCDGGTVPANAWARCRIPLTALNAANATVDGVQLQEGAGRTLPVMYFDELQLTPAAPPPPPPSTTSWVYRDALVSPWADWSWATRNLANTSPVAAGSDSISVSFGAWQGLYFHHAGFPTTSWAAVTLRVHGGTGGGGAALKVRTVVNGALTAGTDLGPTCASGAVLANAWTACTVPLSAIAPAGATITGLVIQENAGRTLPQMYFDEIGFASATPAPAPAVAVTISPVTATLASGGTQQFTASVTGTTDGTVTWSIQEGAAGGTISSGGLYTAPASAGTYHVVATSNADHGKTAISVVTVTAPPPPPPSPPPPVSVALSPGSGSVDACRTLQFTATVTGASDTSVTWAVQEGASAGTIDASGVYTAPQTAGTYHVVGTSHADPTKSAVVPVTVNDRILSVAVAPQQVSVAAGGAVQLNATVTTSCGTFTASVAGP